MLGGGYWTETRQTSTVWHWKVCLAVRMIVKRYSNNTFLPINHNGQLDAHNPLDRNAACCPAALPSVRFPLRFIWDSGGLINPI